MCNCNTTTSCLNCQQGIQCNCPPVYPIPNVTVPCTCCPPGYTYRGPTANYLNGSCVDPTGKIIISTIPCVPCDTSTSTDCVFMSSVVPLTCNPSGINPGDNLTTILDKLCFTNPANIMAFLNTISLNQTLYDGLCNLVAGCGSSPGSTTPVIGSLSWTIP